MRSLNYRLLTPCLYHRQQQKDSKEGANPLDGWKPSIPDGQAFELGTDQYTKVEKKGLRELGKVGFVLVAGGLGERLGYSGAKVSRTWLGLLVVAEVLLAHAIQFHRSDSLLRRPLGRPISSTIANTSKQWS